MSTLNVYTIKGLYIGRREDEKNPTYFGTLKGCMRYVDNSHFTSYGEDIKICLGNTVVALQRVIKKQDEIGDYWENQEWQIGKQIKEVK